jgi:hypothetical protein
MLFYNLLFVIFRSLKFAGLAVRSFFYDSDSITNQQMWQRGILRFTFAARSSGWLLLCRETAGGCCCSESQQAAIAVSTASGLLRVGAVRRRGGCRCGGSAERVVHWYGGVDADST